MKKLFITICLIVCTGMLFAQNNIKVVEYKILKFPKDKETEFVVPQDQNWRIEGIISRKENKIEFYIEKDLYLVFYQNYSGVTDELQSFVLPEKTTFRIKPIDGDIALSIAVLKIE